MIHYESLAWGYLPADWPLSDCSGLRKGRECRARYSQYWLLRVKSSALVTGFVLAEGTHDDHQTRCLFGEFQLRYIDVSLTTGGRVPDVTTCRAAP